MESEMIKQEWKIGDCLELLPTIEDKSIDMILTDLPYGTTACKWDSVIPFDKLWKEYYRILRPNGFIVLTASQPFTTEMIHSNINNFSHQWIWEKEQGVNPLLSNVMPMKNFEDVVVFSNEYKKYDYELKNPLREYFYKILEYLGKNSKQIERDLGHRKLEHSLYVLPKKNIIDKIGQKIDYVLRYGSTQFGLCTENTYNELLDTYNLRDVDFIKSYEEIEVINIEFEKTLPEFPRIYNPQKTNGKPYISGKGTTGDVTGNVVKTQTQNNGDRFPTSIIKFNRETGIHPTQKPVSLAEYLIKTYTNEGDTVHDSCMGSGWSLYACRNLNRNYVGFEISDEWESNYKINDSKLDAWLQFTTSKMIR